MTSTNGPTGPAATSEARPTSATRRAAGPRGFCHKHESLGSIRLRRNVLFAHWAAGRLSLPADAVADYARSLHGADGHVQGDDDIADHVIADFAESGIGLCRTEVFRRLSDFHARALRETAVTD